MLIKFHKLSVWKGELESEIMNEKMDLYTDYLHTTFGKATATGLSDLLNGALSHDQITRMLAEGIKGSKDLWMNVKPLVRKYENDEGCLIFDDTLIEKEYTDENELICSHWNHAKGEYVRGINLLTAFYYSEGVKSDLSLRVPIGYECITKPVFYTDLATKKVKRKSIVSKNELMRAMIEHSINQRLKFKYVLSDSWFASVENIELIHKCNKFFIFDIKQNRLSVFSYSDKRKGNWKKISDLDIPEQTPVKVFLKGCDIEMLLIKQVFTNKDGSTGTRYLISNDLKLSKDDFETIYKKRWSVEEYHKSLKQNNAAGKSPTRTVVTQSNHIFASLLSYIKMESYKLVFKINHFALKGKIYAEALKTAFEELRKLKKQMAEVGSA